MPQTPSPANRLSRVVGADIGKARVVLFDSVSQRSQTVANSPEALTRALAAFGPRELFLCEATGGYERAFCEAACALGLPVARADAAKAKAFILSHGGRAKTDPIDAQWLAEYAAERGANLPKWSPPSAERAELAELGRFRAKLVAQRAEAKNRRSAPKAGPGADLLAAMLQTQIELLCEQIKALEARIDEITRRSAELARAERVLRRMPGVGAVAASTLLGLLPELGALSGKQAASLAGLAPHPKDSGQRKGRRRTGGGRAELRPVLFMAALSAARCDDRLRAFYQRLLDDGKPKRLALAAVARKIVVIANARLRDDAKTATAH